MTLQCYKVLLGPPRANIVPNGNWGPGCRLGAAELGFLHHGFRFQLLVLGGSNLSEPITKHFRYLKWRVSEPYFWLFWRWVFPYISRIHTACIGEYLHFRYLKCLVIQGGPSSRSLQMECHFLPLINDLINQWVSLGLCHFTLK